MSKKKIEIDLSQFDWIDVLRWFALVEKIKKHQSEGKMLVLKNNE